MEYKKVEKPPRTAAVRNTHSLYSKILVDMWDDFVNAKKRMESEGPFLLKHLGKRRQRVFNAATGTGVDSIFLLKNGYEVTSNELDRHFLKKAVENAANEGLSLKLVSHDWRELDRHIRTESSDAIICLGNSLAHLFEQTDQLMTLRNFLRLLDRNGILIIDIRNHEYLLRNREAIMNSGKFRYSGRYVYCGVDRVHGQPVGISDKRIRMEYSHLRTGKKAYLDIYPLRVDEMYGLLNDAGFGRITLFSDYRPGLDYDADFHQFVCVRPHNPTPQLI